jgi:hypothetical protein
MANSKHPEFATHRLNRNGFDKAQIVVEAFDQLLDTLIGAGCDSAPRYLALVKTKLEEASFFAKKALATQPANQEKTPPPQG